MNSQKPILLVNYQDNIKKLEYDNNKTILYSKNLTGLNPNDYAEKSYNYLNPLIKS